MNSSTAYVIRQARPADTGAIMGLIAEAATWLAGKGLDQWQGPSGRRRLLVRRDIEFGSVFVVIRLCRVVGTITVDDLADADFWREDDQVRTAHYIHRMVIARSEAGKGLGGSLLDWAAARARIQDKKHLRLDAWSSNVALHRYYTGLDFTMVRNDPVRGRGSGALFERDAQVERRTGPELLDRATGARPALGAASVERHE